MRQDTPIRCHAAFFRSLLSFFMVLRTTTKLFGYADVM